MRVCRDDLEIATRVGRGGRLRIRIGPLSRASVNSVNRNNRSVFLQINESLGVVGSVHSYSGGVFWRPVVHALSRLEGKQVSLQVKRLTHSDFVGGLSPMVYRNTFGARWAPPKTTVSGFSLEGTSVVMAVRASPRSDAYPDFSIKGKVGETFGNSNGSPRLEFRLDGLLGGTRRVAVCHSRGLSEMGIEDGREFRRVKTVYFDGVRLVLIYDKFRGFNSYTLYEKDPSNLYSISEEPIPLMKLSDYHTLRWFSIGFARELEQKMLTKGSSYDHGRLGVEIAYTILKKEVGTGDFVIPEPSRGGKDLYSSDCQVSAQARLIYDLRQFRPVSLKDVLKAQLRLLLRKVSQDFAYNPRMSTGFVVLSFFGPDRNLHAILATIDAGQRVRGGPSGR